MCTYSQITTSFQNPLSKKPRTDSCTFPMNHHKRSINPHTDLIRSKVMIPKNENRPEGYKNTLREPAGEKNICMFPQVLLSHQPPKHHPNTNRTQKTQLSFTKHPANSPIFQIFLSKIKHDSLQNAVTLTLQSNLNRM